MKLCLIYPRSERERRLAEIPKERSVEEEATGVVQIVEQARELASFELDRRRHGSLGGRRGGGGVGVGLIASLNKQRHRLITFTGKLCTVPVYTRHIHIGDIG